MNRSAQSGLTLVEMMITLIIAGILASIAIPSFVDTVANSRRSSNANDYFIGFQFARSEAIKRNTIVTICPSSDGQTCNGTGRWETGYIVFDNPNLNLVVDAPAETVARAFSGAAGDSTTVRSSSAAIATAVHFSAGGFPQDNTGAPQGAVFRLCDSDGLAAARGIELSPSGRSRVTSDSAVIGACP